MSVYNQHQGQLHFLSLWGGLIEYRPDSLAEFKAVRVHLRLVAI